MVGHIAELGVVLVVQWSMSCHVPTSAEEGPQRADTQAGAVALSALRVVVYRVRD